MKAKVLIGLAALTAVIAAGAVMVTQGDGGSGAGAPAANQRLYPDLLARINDAQTLTVARAESSVTLKRGEAGWTMVEKGNYPADFERVRKFLLEIAQLNAIEAKTKLPESYAALEVEDIGKEAKSSLVTLQDGAGKDMAKLLIGKSRFGRGTGGAGDGTYVRKAGDAQAWMVGGRLSLERDAIGWLPRSIMNLPRDRVRSVVVIQPDGSKLAVQREKMNDKNFTVLDIPAGRKPRSEYDVNEIGGAFASLDLEDVRPVADIAFPADGARVELKTFDGLTMTARLAEHDGQSWFRFEAGFGEPAQPPLPEEVGSEPFKQAEDVKKEVAELNAKIGPWAYRLPAYKAEVMRKKRDDLLIEDKAS